MALENAAEYSSVDAQTLVPLVRCLLADQQADLLDWSFAQLPCFGVNPVTTGIYRFSGHAQSGGKARPWSLILKVLHWLDLGSRGKDYLDNPSDWNYWRREAEVHRSGILANWHGGLRAVRCLSVFEPAPMTFWIWLQDLGAQDQKPWPIERHVLAARHFGEFNGAHAGFVSGSDNEIWLCRHFLRKWIGALQSWGLNQTLSDATFWATRDAQIAFRPDTDVRVRRLLANADGLCNLLAAQMQTLSHQDCHQANLFATGNPLTENTTTAIDWSFLGFAAIGEDLGTQIGGNLFNLFADAANAKDYYGAATAAYLDGLTQSGWRGNPDRIRFATAAAACLRYVPFGVMWLQGCIQAKARGEPSGIDHLAQERRLDTDDVLLRWGAAMSFLLELGNDAIRFAGRH